MLHIIIIQQLQVDVVVEGKKILLSKFLSALLIPNNFVGFFSWARWGHYFFPHGLSFNEMESNIEAAQKVEWFSCCCDKFCVARDPNIVLVFHRCIVSNSRKYIEWSFISSKKIDVNNKSSFSTHSKRDLLLLSCSPLKYLITSVCHMPETSHPTL